MKGREELKIEMAPGFRFHPTDDELVTHYLCRKCASQPISVPIIADIHLYRYNPWQLPEMAVSGDKEWYFFTPRDRKYPNGSRPNRAAGCGYWKATGADKPIGHPRPVAIKKALVFYAGKAPKGDKTNWIMHEYRLADVDRSARKGNAKHRTNNSRLDDWVLCRIYNKKGSLDKQNRGKNVDILANDPQQSISHSHMTCNMATTSDSIQQPQLHTDSTTSCSEREVGNEHLITPSEKEVESVHKSKELDFDFTSFDFTSQIHGNQMSPLQDIFKFLQKPF